MTLDELRAELLRRSAYPNTQTKFAAELGVSLSYLNAVICGTAKPGRKLLGPLKLERKTVYVRVK